MLFYLGQILEQSLLSLPLVLGIYVSFSVLKIADLGVDGSFVLGASVFASLTMKGMPLFIAMTLAVMAGMVAGGIGATIQSRNRVDPLITGILMAFIMHSLSLVIMQRPNIGLLNATTIFSKVASMLEILPSSSRLLTLFVLMGSIALVLSFFLVSRPGLWLKAFGNSQELVATLGRNPENLRMLGLSLCNGLSALSGCLTAQASGYADINMGFGQALIAIAMILLGREILRLLGRRDVLNDFIGIFCTFIGVTIYVLLTNELIRHGLSPIYIKMVIGILLISFLLLASHRGIQHRSISI